MNNTQIPEKGLSLDDIEKQYNNDPYRNKSNLKKKKKENNFENQEHYSDEENLSNFSNNNSYNNSNKNNNNNFPKLNIIESDASIEMASNGNSTAKNITATIKKNILSKKEFAEKLRSTTTKFGPKRIRRPRVNVLNERVNNNKSRNRSTSPDSDSSSNSSYTTTSRSRSNSPQPSKVSKTIKQNSRNPSRADSKATTITKPETPKPKLTPEEQAERLKKNYQFQGFHPYYDKEADVLGIACCTCCLPSCKKMNNGCRGCSNLISCPVYCWVLFIIPVIVILSTGIIILCLVGAKVIK